MHNLQMHELKKRNSFVFKIGKLNLLTLLLALQFYVEQRMQYECINGIQ